MSATVGDRVQVQPASVHAAVRIGTVEAVLSEAPARYQVRWDGGRWSIIGPTDGVLRVIPPSRRGARRTRRRAAASAERGGVSDG